MRPWRVLLFWGLLLLIALPFAARVGEVLTAQPDSPPRSVARAVQEVLLTDFAVQSKYSVVLLADAGARSVTDPRVETEFGNLVEAVRALPTVASVQDYREEGLLPLLSPDGSYGAAIVNLTADTREEAQAAVEEILPIKDQPQHFDLYLSGGPALSLELQRISERDVHRAEVYGLPLSLAVLMVAFGALLASGLPILIALLSVTLTFAVLYGLGQVFEFALFTQTIVTMLGLATGIDYALLIVNRFREELGRSGNPREAAAAATLTAGKAVAFSGCAVIVALGALLIPPLNFIRSIGIGGVTVLLMSVLVSVTALPALLTLLGHRVNWVRLTRREPGRRTRTFWRGWAERVTRRPLLWGATGTLLLLLLGLPALSMQVADPGARGMSRNTDAYRVLQGLQAADLEGLLTPYKVLLDFGGPDGFFHPSSVRAVSRYTREVETLTHVDQTFSPTTADVPGFLLGQYYATRDLAERSPLGELTRATVSRDGRYALVQVVPDGAMSPAEGRALAGELQAAARNLELSAQVGGELIVNAEWNRVLYRDFPLAVGLIYLVTLVILGVTFRSLLIPVKSILLNTLTIAASFGVLTLIFQYGWGARLLGLSGALGFVDNSAPIFTFALVFGLSMDYEVFLVSRIYEAHKRGETDRQAVAYALSATGGVITSAALIMIAVCGVFAFSDIILIKTLGLGLCVAIFLDATLVRMVLVPSVMTLAGRWNWWLPRPVAKLAKRVDLSHD